MTPATTVIATSGPSSSYPQHAYRNPVTSLVAYLDQAHGSDWAIWEFRGEGTGYPDDAVYNRIQHWAWPDHHPPPFELIPPMMGSMRNWMQGSDGKTHGKRVIVGHCKAGKGRTGTVLCSYLMSEEGWTKDEALKRFTQRRMRPGFGSGVSIPSQLRYVGYVERWVKGGKICESGYCVCRAELALRRYMRLTCCAFTDITTDVEQKIEILEVHVWGLRDGVKLSIEGYVEDNGPWRIKSFHTFHKNERDDLDAHGRPMKGTSRSSTMPATSSTTPSRSSSSAHSAHILHNKHISTEHLPHHLSHPSRKHASVDSSRSDAVSTYTPTSATAPSTTNTIFRPSHPIILPTNDINLAIERRLNTTFDLGLTSIAHVWFNAFHEGNGPENYAAARQKHNSADGVDPPGAPYAASSGVFEIGWDALDGIKGSRKKGTVALDKVAVVWRVVEVLPAEQTAQAVYREPTRDVHPLDVPGAVVRGSDNTRPRAPSVVIAEPGPDENVRGGRGADWHGEDARKAGQSGVGRSEKALADKFGEQGLDVESGSDEDGVDGIQRGLTHEARP